MGRLAAEDRVLTTVFSLSQTQLKTQNSRIEHLVHKVAQQQRHLEKQHLKIQNLQSQVLMLARGGAGGRSSLDLWVWTWRPVKQLRAQGASQT